MKFNSNLLIGKNVNSYEEIISLIKSGEKVFGIYLIVIDKNSKNLIEIIKSTEICKEFYKDKDYTVIGVMNGEKEAVEAVKDIVLNNLEIVSNSDMFKNILLK